MDFHLSKENIQPLRGGRNVAQLGIAIQAQTNRELQRELAQQKEEFENAIRSYEGDDPLELWYHYISWIEQSYPKQGHEGNLVPLLEHCLGKFENDKRYVNDRRFCKLWIKYFDLQNNPFELYQMMYARGLCRECADMYRAWSYYHEVSGDFRNAHNVLELGIKNRAQPIDDLELAISIFFNAIGQQEFGEPQSASSSLQEKRQALTSLQTYKPGRVASVRTVAGEAGVLPSTARGSRSNKVMPIYEDCDYSLQGAAAAAPVSLISVAKRQDAPKENTLNPGPWTTVPVKKRHASSYRGLPFTVHEDTDNIVIAGGIRLPPDHPVETLEDYSTWKVPLVIYEPPDDRMRPMYPKAKAYPSEDVEFSLEEIRSVRYLRSKESQQGRTSFQMVKDRNINYSLERQSNSSDRNIYIQQNQIQMSEQNSSYVMYQDPVSHQTSMKPQEILISHQQFPGTVSQMHCEQEQFQQSVETNPYLHQQSAIPNNLVNINNIQYQENEVKPFPQMTQQEQLSINLISGQQRSLREMQQNSFVNHMSPNQRPMFSDMDHGTQGPVPVNQQNDSRMGENLGQLYNASSGWPQEQQFHGQPFIPLNSPNPTEQINITRFDIWNSPVQDTSLHVSPRTNKPTFDIYEQSNAGIQEQIQPKGSAMKTPFKVLSAEDMAETGSRGGMEMAAAAQPVGSAVRLLAMQDDSSNSSFCDLQPNMTFNCDTQMFNINLNMMKVSTPQPKTSDQKAAINGSSSKKKLFDDLEESYCDVERREPLSTILEETKVLSSTASSSSSSSAATKSSVLTNHTKNPTMVTISEEHNSYLAQNLKANEELRSSLLGNLMDLDSQPPLHQQPLHQPMQSSPVPSLPSSPTRRVPAPTLVTPLKRAPSDPFRANVIKELLERVDFPGVHGQGFVQMPFFSKLRLSKDVVRIGSDAYVIEKQLGKGTYGVVFKAQDLNMGCAVALKYQSPPNKWEFYICRELQARLANHPLVNRFMDVTLGYFCDRASILVSEYMPCGSLLDLVNVVKQKSGKTLKESLCIYFSIEMLKIVEAMHQAKIIHADIKPDNFLISVTPDNNAILQLIDFGCSIDMSFFPEGTSFTKKVITEDFICCEMRDGRPWNYHTDLFCVAASTHVLLFDKYIALQKKDNHWSITHRLARYMKVDLWNMYFSSLLNQQRGPSEIEPLVFLLNEALRKFHHDDFLADMRYIVNILRNR